jgi:hypothetical protein
VVDEIFHERSRSRILLRDFDGIGWSDTPVQFDLLDVLFERYDDAEVSRLELGTNSSILSDVVSHRLADARPLSLVRDLRYKMLYQEFCASERGKEREETHAKVSSQSSYFSFQPPKIDSFPHDRRDDHSSTSVLAMKEVELFEEVERGTSGSFHRVELLNSRFESESLQTDRERLALFSGS